MLYVIILQMIYLNFYGSSHISKHQGLQKAVQRSFDLKDSVFRAKFSLKTFFGTPGATYYKSNIVEQFVQNSSQLSCEEGYSGQISIVVLGELLCNRCIESQNLTQ